MTKDDCINKIQDIKAYLTAGNPIWNTDEIAEACDMAIESLERDKTRITRLKHLEQFNAAIPKWVYDFLERGN